MCRERERVCLRQGNALELESNDLELYIFSQEDPRVFQPHLQEDQPAIQQPYKSIIP